jgi:hypothetical protein
MGFWDLFVSEGLPIFPSVPFVPIALPAVPGIDPSSLRETPLAAAHALATMDLN